MAQRLIYADTLKESMIGACNIFEKRGIDTMIARAVISIIDGIAGVDAEPVRHGRWIKMTGMMPPEYRHYECSECKWHMKGLRYCWTREEELTYCPGCGAKMDGGEINVE